MLGLSSPIVVPVLNNWLMEWDAGCDGIRQNLAALTPVSKDREHQSDQDIYLSDQGKVVTIFVSNEA